MPAPLAGHSTERSTTVGTTPRGPSARVSAIPAMPPPTMSTRIKPNAVAWRSRIAQGARPGPNYHRSVPRAGAEERSEVRLLGPVEVICDGHLVTIGGSRARTLLAVLAIRAGRVVDTSALTEAVWGDHAPRTAAHALHVHASTVRRALGSRGDWLQARPPGYVLALEPDALEIDRFEHAARDGRAELASGRPDAAVARLSDALAFWRGSPLADVPWERFADAEVRRLEMLRLATEEDRVEATLQLGDAKSAAADAEELVAGDPLREHRWILLMRALYASGRHAEALRRGQDVRRYFADEVGLAPSPTLTRLESLIARHDPGLGRPEGTVPPDDV